MAGGERPAPPQEPPQRAWLSLPSVAVTEAAPQGSLKFAYVRVCSLDVELRAPLAKLETPAHGGCFTLEKRTSLLGFL